MKNYLSDKRHRSKINDFYSLFLDLLVGVLQGYILDSVLFNIYIWDFFFFRKELLLAMPMLPLLSLTELIY